MVEHAGRRKQGVIQEENSDQRVVQEEQQQAVMDANGQAPRDGRQQTKRKQKATSAENIVQHAHEQSIAPAENGDDQAIDAVQLQKGKKKQMATPPVNNDQGSIHDQPQRQNDTLADNPDQPGVSEASQQKRKRGQEGVSGKRRGRPKKTPAADVNQLAVTEEHQEVTSDGPQTLPTSAPPLESLLVATPTLAPVQIPTVTPTGILAATPMVASTASGTSSAVPAIPSSRPVAVSFCSRPAPKSFPNGLPAASPVARPPRVPRAPRAEATPASSRPLPKLTEQEVESMQRENLALKRKPGTSR
ncbi:hypothetical protein B0O80DRAFT_304886 [Mortierella sp. GBAus27b]|nr:hypothetical protein B0O80DRAFT_304886 [Mortierella sp. GBAus27b]